jgi:hypothetical protein
LGAAEATEAVNTIKGLVEKIRKNGLASYIFRL